MNIRLADPSTSPRGAACIWPPPLRPDGVRLFCFHYAGGSAAAFADWPAHLPPWLQVCPIELPGRGRRFTEPFARSLRDLAAELAAELRRHAAVPCALFGHSMGALVAYEVARHLASFPESGLRKLCVSGSAAPARRVRKEPPVSSYSDEALRRLLTEMAGTPERILADADFMALLLPRLRADYALCENYRHPGGGTLSLPVTALCGDRDDESAEPDMACWKDVTRGGFTLHVFEGSHFFIDARRAEVLRVLTAELEGFRAPASAPSQISSRSA